jgi:signal transduction histidine kinase
MMMDDHDEERMLQTVTLQNATAVFLARQRAEDELVRTKEALEARTQELMRSLSAMEVTLRELDRARSEAETARHTAQEANEAKSRFLRMISHELRTPLGAIGGYSALIQEGIHGPLTEAQREALARISHNQQHLLGLVDELLDFARMEAGGFQLDIEAVFIQSVMNSVTLMIEPQRAEKDLRLELEVDPRAREVLADRDRVQQILLNLLSNAVKFTPTGGVITVRSAAREQMIDVHVEDTGIGIPADKLEQIFDSFMQVAPSLSPAGGTGLGLAISRQLANAMGGDIKVRSALGKGSTFTLSLPCVTNLSAG